MPLRGRMAEQHPEGIKKIVFRGEHGHYIPGQPLSTKIGSISFGSKETARSYALKPNITSDTPVHPRIIEAEIEINKPVFRNEDDPFIDLFLLRPIIGDARLLEMASELEDHLRNTDNFLSLLEDNECDDLNDLIEKCGESILDDLYIDAYTILDSTKYVTWFAEAGYDGAIHRGNGETMDDIEYKIFNPDQATILKTTHLDKNINLAREHSGPSMG